MSLAMGQVWHRESRMSVTEPRLSHREKGMSMDFKVHSHRHALEILEGVEEYEQLWTEIKDALAAVSDDKIATHFRENYEGQPTKSLSRSINALLKQEFVSRGWMAESFIFGESAYGDHTWRLDFAKQVELTDLDINNDSKKVDSGISIEVAFNHGGSIAWNLLKPVIASEINHVPKNIQTGVGLVICATESLKRAGGFDSAIGTYDQFISNLLPLRNILTVPVLIVGLEAPKSFRMLVEKRGNQNFGTVVNLI